jgi:hypothetical protein
LDLVAVTVVGNPGPAEPGTPVADRCGDPRFGLVRALRCGQSLRPRQRAICPLARAQDVARADAAALDPQRHVRAQADRLLRAAGVGGVAVAVDHAPCRRHPAVVEGRFANELDLDPAFQAQDSPHQQVVSVVVGGRPRVRCDLVLVIPGADRQRVADENPPRGRLPCRGQDVRARLVDPRRGVVNPERPEPEAAGLTVKQAAEYAWRVEAGHAEPVDRAIGRDERAGVAVRQERIIGDRWEWRGSGRTAVLARMGCLSGRCSLLGDAHAISSSPRSIDHSHTAPAHPELLQRRAPSRVVPCRIREQLRTDSRRMKMKA